MGCSDGNCKPQWVVHYADPKTRVVLCSTRNPRISQLSGYEVDCFRCLALLRGEPEPRKKPYKKPRID